jgi:5-methylcytosine-specific restriction protein A
MFRWITAAFGSPRSGSWPRVRREHLAKQPACAACGRRREVEVHHVVPFHEKPELELAPENLVTLCADPCHLVHGHLLDWKRSNPFVREDAARYRSRLEAAR